MNPCNFNSERVFVNDVFGYFTSGQRLQVCFYLSVCFYKDKTFFAAIPLIQHKP